MHLVHVTTNKNDDFKKRLIIFSVIPIVSFFIFVIVLFSLQIIKGPDYELKAKKKQRTIFNHARDQGGYL